MKGGGKREKTKKAQDDPPSSPGGVQKHGKKWENEIINAVVDPSHLYEAMHQPYTATHDIPKHLNIKKPGRHISIKVTGRNAVDFGDALRTCNNISNPESPVDAIVVRYNQSGNQKVPTSVVHIDLTEGRNALLGTMSKDELFNKIQHLDGLVKTGNLEYKVYSKQLQKEMKDAGARLSVAPKIGNPQKGRSGRLQITLPNLNKFIEDFPELVTIEEGCNVFGTQCLSTLESCRRTFKKGVDEEV